MSYYFLNKMREADKPFGLNPSPSSYNLIRYPYNDPQFAIPSQQDDENKSVNCKFKDDDVDHVSEEEAKEIIAEYMHKQCCYAKKSLKYLEFNNFELIKSYKYVLSTFIESRYTTLVSQPDYDSKITLKNDIQIEDIWALEVEPSEVFKNEIRKLEIPNTSNVEVCSNCTGSGTVTCDTCHGHQMRDCMMCDGNKNLFQALTRSISYESFNHKSYYDNYYNSNFQHLNHHNHHLHRDHNHLIYQPYCTMCNGRGKVRCNQCSEGKVSCSSCDRTGYMRFFLELEVRFENITDDFTFKPSDLHEKVLRECSHEKVYKDKKEKLTPLQTHPCTFINKASKDLLQLHSSKYSHSRILAQKHEIYMIPVTLCTFISNNKTIKFYISGFNRKVYSPNYPKTCGCTIL